MGEGPASSFRCQAFPPVTTSARHGVAPGNANLPIGVVPHLCAAVRLAVRSHSQAQRRIPLALRGCCRVRISRGTPAVFKGGSVAPPHLIPQAPPPLTACHPESFPPSANLN